METKKNFRLCLCFWMVLVVMLAACSLGRPAVKPTHDAGINISVTQTEFARPTNTPTLAETLAPTNTKTPTMTHTPLPFVALDGLRIAYTFKGNIYIQDSGKQPIQLTRSGQDHYPFLSDDGQKIAFLRGALRENHQLYTVNEDGSHEQVLVTNNLLTALNLGYDKSTELRGATFVPQTHQLLFHTSEYDPQVQGLSDPVHSRAVPNHDLLLVDTDSATIKQLLPPGKVSDFALSPNGKLIRVLTENHINLIGLDGKTKYHLRDYSAPSPEISILEPDMYWTQDSQKLSLVLPAMKAYENYTGPEFRTTIWKYSLAEGGDGSEINLTPAAIDDDFAISPDGNWIVYAYYYVDGKNELTDKFGIYLGDLRKNTAQLLDLSELDTNTLSDTAYFWSPDSKHFTVQDKFQSQMYIADIDGNIIAHHPSITFRWIDNNHYLLYGALMGEVGSNNTVRITEISPADMKEFTFVFLKR